MGVGAYTMMMETGIPMMRQSTLNALFPPTRVHTHRRGFDIVSRSSLSRVESVRCRHGLQMEENSTSGRQRGIRAGIIYPFHTDSLKNPLQRRQTSVSRVTVALRRACANAKSEELFRGGRLKIRSCAAVKAHQRPPS